MFQFGIDGADIKLKRTHSRVPRVPAEIELKRVVEPILRHVVTNGGSSYPAGTFDVTRTLDQLEVPLDATVSAI